MYTQTVSHISQVQKAWKNRAFSDRQALFSALAEVLKKNKSTYAALITEEMHKPISQSEAEIEKCILLANFYSQCEDLLQPVYHEEVENRQKVRVTREPLGVILGVMPWNYPFWQALRFAVPTLLAGNGILLKHASNCQKCGDAIEELFQEAGFPKGLLLHRPISHVEVEDILAMPEVQGVSLTGSEYAGRKIAELAGRNLKKAVLELGGNDAFIILDDADLDAAAHAAALGRLQNYGQTCIAAKRFIIHEEVYEEALEKIKKAFGAYHSTPPFDKETNFSMMARPDLAKDLEEQYQTALKNGAQPILPLEKLTPQKFNPGMVEISPDNPMADEEIFGPLALVMRGKDDEQILNLANDTRFGLGNAVFTQNETRAIWFADRLESGTVSINQITKSDPKYPFGGWKDSGFGIELSELAVLEFTQTKSLMMKI